MNLWKYIFNSNKEQGFTIPLVLGLGLFMLLSGITAIKMSSSSESNSKIQKTSAQALSAAEVGLARIQALIDAERQVAVFPDCAGTRSANGTCPDASTTPSWANPSAIATTTSSNLCGTTVSSQTLNTFKAIAASTEWQDISTNPKDGQYRLISYRYTPSANPNEPPGIGRLIVEGRTSQGVSGATKSSAKAFNTGIARLKVEIPVNKNILTTTGSVPGLWMKYNNTTQMNNDQINGDIIVEGCLLPGGVSSSNLYDPAPSGTQTVSFSPDPMPDTPALDGLLNNGSLVMNYLIGDGIPSADQTPAGDPAIANPFPISNFPRNEDDPAPDGYYHYLIGSAVINGGNSITISPGKKVIFYLQGNLDMGGSPSINVTAGSTPEQLQIYGNTTVGTGKGLNGSNYKYGCPVGITCPTTQIFFNGTGDVKALIHAPEAIGSVKGGGNAAGQVKGTLWINNWIAGSGSSQVKVDAVGQLSDLLSSTTTETVEPQISVSTTWERVEAK